ncbi:MAG: transcriptional regulator [Anaerolineae bacterium]|nr:MAG: transcriptional regulator [Anaerolineae bacterium]MCL4878782.1 transcriptional regulator [Anaerolineae bacterium]
MSLNDFADLANRFKKQAEVKAQQAAEKVKPIDFNELHALRARIVGVLIRDARIARGYTVEHLAEALQTTPEQLVAWEFGQDSPSLPQLELIAYTLEVPITQLMSGTETLLEQMAERVVNQHEYLSTRDRMIGVEIRLYREQAGLTPDELAARVGLDEQTLMQYEYGQRAVPLSHLSSLASALRVTESAFLEGENRVGRYLEAQEAFELFLHMPPEVRQFIAKPSNHRYIELAIKLAKMDTEKLRELAESILEITL